METNQSLHTINYATQIAINKHSSIIYKISYLAHIQGNFQVIFKIYR